MSTRNRQYETGTKVQLRNPYRIGVPGERTSVLSQAPRATIFAKDDVLIIKGGTMDMRHSTYPEQYKAGEISNIGHTDLSIDATRKEDGVHSPVALKLDTKAYLKKDYSDYRKGTEVILTTEAGSMSGIGVNNQTNTLGRATSATPLAKIVYNAEVYLTAWKPIDYISSGYIPHNDLKEI